MDESTFKLAAVAAALAADPSLHGNRAPTNHRRDQGGQSDRRARQDKGYAIEQNPMAGAWIASPGIRGSDVGVLVRTAESASDSRDSAWDTQAMKLRRGWKVILFATGVLVVFIAVLTGFHLAEGWR